MAIDIDKTPAPDHAPWALIVGAGPAGLTLANLLGRAGIPTLLIEKNAGLSGQPKALMVDDEFFRLLSSLGLGDAVRAHGIGPVAFEVYSPFGFRVARIAGRITEHHAPTRTATFQPEFERILLAGAQRYAHVRIAFSHELQDFHETPDGIVARVRTPEGVREISLAYLLAADGAHSPVRKALDIPFDELVAFGQRQIVVDVAGDPDLSTVAVTRLGWRRNYTSLPAPGGRRYEFSLRPGEEVDAMLDDATLARLFRAQGLDYPGMTLIRKVVYTFHSRLARRMQQGRVFLLGDAAHIMPVFGSQGMNSGARDANNLAWKLAAVFRGTAGPGILDSYHDERHVHVAETIRIATANGKLQSVRHLPVTALRDLALGALSLLPPLRRYVAEMRFIPKPYLRRGLILAEPQVAPVRPGPATPSLIGKVLPQPAITAEDGNWRLLDEYLGPGFALVGIEPATDGAPAGLRDALWERLGTRKLAIYRPETALSALPVTQLRAATSHLDEVFASHAGQWLLIRPDRVIAAAASPECLSAIASQFADRLGDPQPALRLAS